MGVDALGRLTAKPVDKFWTTHATAEFPVATTFSLEKTPPFFHKTLYAQFLLSGVWSRLFFWRVNGGYGCRVFFSFLYFFFRIFHFTFLYINTSRPWVLNVANPGVLLGPDDLQREQLNTWEAVPVTSSVQSVTVVEQWVSGAAERSGSSVTLTDVTDGEHVLLLKARDRAGNLSPQYAQVNWTVDSNGPWNCSVVSLNAQSLPGWTRSLVLPAAVNSSSMLLQLAGSPEDRGGPFAVMSVRWWSTLNSGSGVGGTSRLTLVAGAQTAAVSLQNLTDGQYQLEVVGEDLAGNRSPQPCANLSWAVDLTPPVGLLPCYFMSFFFFF